MTGRRPEQDQQQDRSATRRETIPDEIIAKLPDGTPPEVLASIVQAASYSGPLPPPSMFREYNQELPGSADRLLQMVEKEQTIRSRNNRHILVNDSFRVGGSIIVSLALIGAGVYCGVIGQPWLGGVLGTSGAISGIIKAYWHRPQ